MSSEQDVLRLERAALRDRYGTLFDAIAALLFTVDPMGINFETNTDEYEPEVGTILPRLNDVKTAEDVQVIVYEEFVRWFGVDEAGPSENYQALSISIFEVWNSFNTRPGKA